MGVHKGTNNFADYQAGKVEAKKQLIEAELKDLRHSKVTFENIRLLARYLQKLTHIDRTTLLRPELPYREMLRKFLIGQRGATITVDPDEANAELLRAMLIDKDIEIGLLKADLDRTNKRLELAMQQLDERSLPAPSDENPGGDQQSAAPWDRNLNANIPFQDTAFVLWELMVHINQLARYKSLTFGTDTRLLEDQSLKPSDRQRTAIGPEKTRWFAEWLKQNPDFQEPITDKDDDAD